MPGGVRGSGGDPAAYSIQYYRFLLICLTGISPHLYIFREKIE
jgi:hypothetical protein